MKKTLIATLTALTMMGSAYAAQPNVTILATGGTIAGTAASASQMTGYKAGDLGIQILLDAVPQVKQVANVTGEQFVKMASQDMTDDVWLNLARRCNELLASDKVDGIVITHGTDTLEETAYFLNLTVKSDKPIVLVGAQRPATAISADGPLNLLNAVKVAASKDAVGKGVMIVMNDEINGARDVMKTNTTNVSTFHSPNTGALGYISGGRIDFLSQSVKRHTAKSEFDVSSLKSLPRVDIVFSHENDDGVMVNAAVAAGAKGIVHAGTGNGSIHKDTFPSLIEAGKKGVVMIRASRLPSGVTTKSRQSWADAGCLEAHSLSPQKARILLMLGLTKTQDPAKIQQMFFQY